MTHEAGYDANKAMIRGEIGKILDKHVKPESSELMSGRTSTTIAMQVEAAFPDRFGLSRQDLVAEVESVMDEKEITFTPLIRQVGEALDKVRQQDQ